MSNEIKTGTVVSVNFHGAQFTLCEEAIVLSMPYGSGDSWIFLDLQTNKQHSISEPCTVSFIRESK